MRLIDAEALKIPKEWTIMDVGRVVTAGEYMEGYWYGRTPSVAITSVEDGFDWDDEVILLMPDKALIRKGKK